MPQIEEPVSSVLKSITINVHAQNMNVVMHWSPTIQTCLFSDIFYIYPQQSSNVAVGYALGGARILDHVIQSGSDGVQPAVADLKDPNRSKKFTNDADVAAAIEKGEKTSSDHIAAVKTFGLACGE